MKENIFEKLNIDQLSFNPFNKIGDDWMLITAGIIEKFNTMTASWGTLGILWNKPIAIIFIRPQRYTFGFVKKNEFFTLSFFEAKHKKILQYCGSHSGRDVNKIKETGLEPFTTENKNITFKQAQLFFECKKLYYDRLEKDNFILKELISNNYPTNDFHYFIIGEIVDARKRV